MTEELFKKYIHYFGDKPPFPPKHIMESLVRMKDDGTFDEKLKAVSSLRGELREKIEEVLPVQWALAPQLSLRSDFQKASDLKDWVGNTAKNSLAHSEINDLVNFIKKEL